MLGPGKWPLDRDRPGWPQRRDRGAWEVAGGPRWAGVALEARAGLKVPMLLRRGRPVRSQGDRGCEI